MNSSSPDPAQGFRIGSWRVRPTACELIDVDGGVQHLEPMVMDVLIELARAYPEVMERDAVIRTVWSGRPMADDGLARCIAALRKALGDSRSQQRYIQTVTKRGYRLLESVEPDVPGPSSGTRPEPAGDGTVEDWTGPLEFDQLKILRLLGRGSMGVVHLAQETNLERLVAVKTLRGAIASDDRAVRRFNREASAAARIDHPNVTTVHRLGELPDGTPYFVMQYVRGRTLTALMASSGEVSRYAAIAIVGQIAAALATAHDQRIVHRDVKPANVMIDNDSNAAVLGDFGIAGIQETGARIATRLTLHGEILGDARYISPEQARGDPPTPASDVYSLGIIAYELLSGSYPYSGGGKDLAVHLDSEPQPLSVKAVNVDPGIERIIMQALAKAPDERPTAAQFLAGLDRPPTVEDIGSTGAHRPGPTGEKPWSMLILAAMLLLGLIVTTLLILR